MPNRGASRQDLEGESADETADPPRFAGKTQNAPLRCPLCGWPLEALEGACPGCGRDLVTGAPPPVKRFRPPWIDRRLLLALLVLALLGAGGWALLKAIRAGADRRASAAANRAFSERRFDQARANFEQALDYNPNNAEAWAGIAAVHALSGRWEEAAHAAQRALTLVPNANETLPLAHFALGRALLAQGHDERALDELERAAKLDPSIPSLLHALARGYQRNHRYPEAFTTYLRALEIDAQAPEAPESRLELGRLLLRRSRLDEAERELEAAAREGAPAADVAIALGDVYMRRGQRIDAMRAYERAVRLRPRDIEALRRLAEAQLRMRRFEDARATLERALALAPTDTALLRLSAEIFVAQGALEQAASVYEKALQASPRDARVQTELATVLARLGRHTEALALLEQATEAEPPYLPTFAALAELYGARGEIEREIDTLRRALKIDPLDTRLRERLGRALLAANERDLAIVALEMAAQGRGEAAVRARRKLVELYLQSENDKAAIAHLSAIVDAEPKDADATTELARLLLKVGQRTRALELLEGVLKENPRHPQARSLLERARALQTDGERERRNETP